MKPLRRFKGAEALGGQASPGERRYAKRQARRARRRGERRDPEQAPTRLRELTWGWVE